MNRIGTGGVRTGGAGADPTRLPATRPSEHWFLIWIPITPLTAALIISLAPHTRLLKSVSTTPACKLWKGRRGKLTEPLLRTKPELFSSAAIRSSDRLAYVAGGTRLGRGTLHIGSYVPLPLEAAQLKTHKDTADSFFCR
jgi:hypothetical protein